MKQLHKIVIRRSFLTLYWRLHDENNYVSLGIKVEDPKYFNIKKLKFASNQNREDDNEFIKTVIDKFKELTAESVNQFGNINNDYIKYELNKLFINRKKVSFKNETIIKNTLLMNEYKDSSTLFDFIEKWLAYKSIDPRCSPSRTIALNQLYSDLKKNLPPTIKPEEITSYHLMNLHIEMKERLAQTTLCKRFNDLKGFYKWLSIEHKIPLNESVKTYNLNITPDNEYVVFSKEQINFIYNMQPENYYQEESLDIYKFLLNTGLSITDYTLINSTNLKNHFLMGKRKKTGTKFKVPINSIVQSIIDKYGIDNLPKYRSQTSSRTFKRILKKYELFNKEVTLKQNDKLITKPFYKFVCNHTCRRTFIDIMLLNRTPINVLMGYVAHKSPDMLLHYASKYSDNTLYTPSLI